MDLADAVEAWIRSRRSVRKLVPTTERTYRFYIAKFSAHVGSHTPIRDITTGDIESWMATLDHLQDSSLKTATEPIRSLFSWAVEAEHIDRDPTRKIPRPELPPPRYRGLEPDVVARLLHVADFRERSIILAALHLGLRCCEMERFGLADWDRQAQQLHVRGKGGRGNITRILPVEGEIEWALEMWVGDRRTGPFLPSQHGVGLQANSISQIVTRVARRARVAATAHRLRHACAHDMIAMGAEFPAVQRFLGHRSSETTKVYTAAHDRQLRAVMSRTYVVNRFDEMGQAA